MSLYNALFGKNPFSGVLLQMLSTNEAAIPRFRDCYLNEDGSEIIIHTRTGGGNRDHYDHPDRHRKHCDYENCDHSGPFNEDMRNLPGFTYDEDDDFDSTYADFHFVVPESFKGQIALLKDLGGVGNPAERWQALLNDLKSGDTSKPEVSRALKVGEQILGQIQAAIKTE